MHILYICINKPKKSTNMKKIFTLTLLLAIAFVANAQTKKVSILGDSYSTYKGYIPDNYAPFYPDANNDVKDVEQMWWSLYIKAMGYELDKNNSWGGTTICNTGYGRMDSSKSSFTSRVDMLGNPDIIFIFGGTNDAWAGSPIGEYKYEGWTQKDLFSFRPAMAKMLSFMIDRYPNVEIYFILNDGLQEEINESVKTICEHYQVPCIVLKGIDKSHGHPTIKGMQTIKDGVLRAMGK